MEEVNNILNSLIEKNDIDCCFVMFDGKIIDKNCFFRNNSFHYKYIKYIENPKQLKIINDKQIYIITNKFDFLINYVEKNPKKRCFDEI